MRNLCLLITITLFAACTKETEEESYISYTYKGTEVKYTGSYQSWQATKKGIYAETSTGTSPFGPPYFIIQGFDGGNGGIMIMLRSDSVTAGTYSSYGDPNHLATGIQMKPDSNPAVGYVFSSVLYNPKAMLVNITRHSDGRVSGTFSCWVYNHLMTLPPKDSTEISGEFKNVEVRYN